MKQVITAVPNVRLSAKGLRRRQNLIIAAILFAALLGPIAFLTRSSSTPLPVTSIFSPRTVSFAEMVAEDFLSGEATPLPAASGVDRTFGRRNVNGPVPFDYISMVHSSTDSNTVSGRRVDTIGFNVESGDGVLYKLSIPVTFSPSGLRLLAASPSMSPATFAADGSVDALEAELTISDIPEAVLERVDLWALAYARDDSQALRVIVNDADAPAGGSYLGLGGFSCREGCSEVLWASVAPQDNSLYITRVKVLFTSTSANEFTMSNEFDLLVRGWESDAPRILAWGSAGSGETLTPYTNNTALQGP